MRTSSRWDFRFMGKFLMGLVLAAVIGSMDVVPSFGDDHDRGERHDKGRYEKRGRGHDRGHYVYEHGRRVYRPYGYVERVYVPPPVIYAPPPPPPGISIFLPPIHIR